MKKAMSLALVSLCAAVVAPLFLTGCGGDGDSGTTPATNLNATGFWENPLNDATAAGNVSQNGGNVTGYLLLPPMGMGNLIGTVDGYHMSFTMAWDSGTSESGSGDFAFVDTGVDKLILTGNLPSVGNFVISWRGPSFEEHNPAGVTLTYTPPAPTW
ncbi:MAG: hypothetical protein NT011_09415 [Kiritimatiellaeota bacterium]|nr:hypothetical protein [Kiritimatiellota bacterium]